MGFLLRRNRAVAKAGWWDAFTRANENPPLKPWGVWGDVRPNKLESNKLMLGANGGWFPNNNGGIGYAYQPLTPEWGLEFRMERVSYAIDFTLNVYLDQNWTTGTNALNNRYQRVVTLDRVTTDDGNGGSTTEESVTVYTRDKNTWFSSSAARYLIPVMGQPHNVAVRVIQDKYVFVSLDGVFRVAFNLDTDYLFVANAKAANFYSLDGNYNCMIDNFATYDFSGETFPMGASLLGTATFVENFDRANNEVVGNGWTEFGQAISINTNALAVSGGTDGTRGVWQAGVTTTNGHQVAILVMSGSIDSTRPVSILFRMSADGSKAIRFRFTTRSVYIDIITAGANTATPTVINIGQSAGALPANIAAGEVYVCKVWRNYAWIEHYPSGKVYAFSDGIETLYSAHVPETNRRFGATLHRSGFVNSAKLDYVWFGHLDP